MGKKKLYGWLMLVWLISYPLKAQLSEGGIPPGFNGSFTQRTSLAPVKIPVNFSIEDLKSVDEWQANQRPVPLRVAKGIPVYIRFEEQAASLTLSGGEKIRQLRLQVKGALALMLYYDEFYIPEGGKLFIYNSDKTHLLGAYTSKNNPSTGKYATEFVAGDDIILEYVEAPVEESPRILIEQIGYGYQYLNVDETMELRSSGSCMVNINCEEGDAWQPEKKGVCRMIMKVGRESYLCTGSLVNNTAEDLKHYILSAYHCSDDGDEVASEGDFLQWQFYFNYERSGCSNTSPLLSSAYSLTGCTKITESPIDGGTDGLLLLLNEEISDSYNPYFNGWDRSSNYPQSGVNIHHPQGDYKKISTYTDPIASFTWEDDENNIGVKRGHWNAIFSQTANGYGVTEGGSSGSPLFNEEKYIVGTLTGGNSSCLLPIGYNIYGKVSYHMDYGSTSQENMAKWLDPLGTGVKKLAGRYKVSVPSPKNVQVKYENKAVKINWNKPDGDRTPTGYYIYVDNSYLASTERTEYSDTQFQPGEHLYAVSAYYENGDESSHIFSTVTAPEYKQPENISFTKTDNQVVIQWKAPEYQQTIYWGIQSYNGDVGFGDYDPFYFGQYWDEKEIESFYQRTLKAVQFIPVIGEYDIFIYQGGRSYSQAVSLSYSDYGQLKTIELDTPFVIGSGELFVSMYAHDFYDRYLRPYPAAICDEGGIARRSNIASFDGEEWFAVRLEEDEVFSFLVTAIVSSEKGVINEGGLRNSKEANSITLTSTLQVQKAENKHSQSEILSLRTQSVSEFTDPKGYNIFRNGIKQNRDLITETHYADNSPLDNMSIYSVSAVYEEEESNPTEISVDNLFVPSEQKVFVVPTVFSDEVKFTNYHLIKQIEVYSSDGKMLIRQTGPISNISTGNLPEGMYIFRLYINDGIEVVKGIKK